MKNYKQTHVKATTALAYEDVHPGFIPGCTNHRMRKQQERLFILKFAGLYLYILLAPLVG
jgi:hypothetical protein